MKNLKLAEWANIAEVAACIMVVVSIMYAITEYNREKFIDSSDIDTILYDRGTITISILSSNPEMAALVFKAESTYDELTEFEKFRYVYFRMLIMNDWETAFIYHREGRMDDTTWTNWNNAYQVEANKFPAFFWENSKDYFSDPEFVDMIETTIFNQ